MEVVTKYKALDGCEFTDPAECRKHEANYVEAMAIIAGLGEKPTGSDFSNGSGFLQHDRWVVLKVRNEFLEFAKRYTDHRWIQESIEKGFDAHPSHAGRIIDECLPMSISKHWFRFMCIDEQSREWGQPYFALNPNEGNQIKLN